MDEKPHAGDLVMSGAGASTQALLLELDWFGQVLADRLFDLGLHPGERTGAGPDTAPLLPDDSGYGNFVREYRLKPEERLILILSLLPHLKPETLTALLQNDTCRQHLGGIPGKQFAGFLPTVQTALVLSGGIHLQDQLNILPLFAPESDLIRHGLIRLGNTPPGEPLSAAPLYADEGVVSRITWGRPFEPSLQDFPAHRLTTPLDWEDLILAPVVLRQLQDILDWAREGHRLQTELGLGKHLRPGYKALFYGPPGTGKTLSAALIGKHLQLPVYRVDLSQVVSKYIGETEKNLEQLFRLAENRDWILFFDEADALFNKRTEVENSRDRHANQETAYLLQRLENYPNLVIMATNMQDNIDKAFTRRFNCGVFYPMPGKAERMRLWTACLGEKLTLSDEASRMLPDYELSGGQIANISLRLGLWALKNNTCVLSADAVKRSVMLERILEGKV